MINAIPNKISVLPITIIDYEKLHSTVNQSAQITNRPNPKTSLEKKSRYLNIEVIQKILMKIIGEKKMSLNDLATSLRLKVDDLVNLINGKFEHLIPQINLRLVKLYCEIDWGVKSQQLTTKND